MAKKPMERLRNSMPQVGEVVWIGLRPTHQGDVNSVDETEAVPGTGLNGDYFKGSADGRRQVTLIQQEHLTAIAAILNKKESDIDPSLMRRNVVVKGINLAALKERTFSVGDVILEWTGWCHPCSLMEKNLGPGGYNAMAGHGGILARVIKGGPVKVGHKVKLVLENEG